MVKQNLQSLESFKTNESNISEVLGGHNDMYFAPKIRATGKGVISGMQYSKDTFFDDDADGKWDAGESINFHWAYDTGTTRL